RGLRITRIGRLRLELLPPVGGIGVTSIAVGREPQPEVGQLTNFSLVEVAQEPSPDPLEVRPLGLSEALPTDLGDRCVDRPLGLSRTSSASSVIRSRP